MSFNPESSKQAQKAIFTCNLQKKKTYFNDSSVKETCTRLDFQEHWKSLLKKVNNIVALLRKFQNILPRSALLTIYNIIDVQAFNSSFHQKLNPYNIKQLQLSQLPLEERRWKKIIKKSVQSPFQQRHWCRKLCHFFKVYKNQCPKYLFNKIPQLNGQYRTRNAHNIPHMNVKHQFFKNSHFPSTITVWNKLDFNIYNSKTLNIFKSKIFKFIRSILVLTFYKTPILKLPGSFYTQRRISLL